jgi:hypothetical protein
MQAPARAPHGRAGLAGRPQPGCTSWALWRRSPAARPDQAANYLSCSSGKATDGWPAQAAVESSEADWEGRLKSAVDSAEQWNAFADKLAAERGALDAELAGAREDAQARAPSPRAPALRASAPRLQPRMRCARLAA